MITTTIKEAIARIKDWEGKKISYTSVTGGITNPNYKVTVDEEDFFLKIPGTGTDFIDRFNCHMANVIADKSGAGPKVYYFFEDTGVEVFEWLDGYRQVTYGDIYKEKIFKKIFNKLSDYHNIENEKLPQTQSLFEQAWDMNARAKEAGYIPPWNDRMEYLLHVIEDAIKSREIEYKPCHNDFWTNNIMYNEETQDLKIIDYEYASMNDPYSDLGVISGINYFTEDMDIEMVKIYNHGEFDEIGYTKMKLYKIVSDIKWAYWALQQTANSNVEYDYMNWYGTKIARLQHLWQDPRLDSWMNRLKGTPIFRTK